ncbi:MAG: SDR family oxidoreductase [Chitinispirillales bacterium]|jgi:3-oxoacyl-[acyl-carrier protein] reductase|nr:SDR family oxidoreductase [Chitinispirillales bacterium]
MKIDLSGKTALITGSSGELGRVMARTLAACGADTALHYHKNKDSAVKLAKEIQSMGRRSEIFQADITEAPDIEVMRDAVANSLGFPQIIINNAVIQYTWKSVLEQDIADYESQFRSCVMHNVHMTKAFVPEMVKARFGRIISINTECSMQTLPSQSAYAAAKRGMDGLLRVLAREVGPYGITVNQVAPGWTMSEKYKDSKPQGADTYASNVPLRRMGTDQDIANAVVFLASDLASFITGAFIPVCGGNVMPCI